MWLYRAILTWLSWINYSPTRTTIFVHRCPSVKTTLLLKLPYHMAISEEKFHFIDDHLKYHEFLSLWPSKINTFYAFIKMYSCWSHCDIFLCLLHSKTWQHRLQGYFYVQIQCLLTLRNLMMTILLMSEETLLVKMFNFTDSQVS